MQGAGAGGFPWSRESLIFPLCSFHFAVPPLFFNKQFPYFLWPNFLPCVSKFSMSVGSLDTGGGKKWLKIGNEKDIFYIPSAFHPEKAQTSVTVRKAVLLDWLPGFHLFTPTLSCRRGHWRAAPSGVRGCHGQGIKVQRLRVLGFKLKTPYIHNLTYTLTHTHSYTFINIYRDHTTSSPIVRGTKVSARKCSCSQDGGKPLGLMGGTIYPFPLIQLHQAVPALLSPSQITESPRYAPAAQRLAVWFCTLSTTSPAGWECPWPSLKPDQRNCTLGLGSALCPQLPIHGHHNKVFPSTSICPPHTHTHP